MTQTGAPRDEIVEHLPAMRAFAVSLTHDAGTADDLVHDTVIKAWTNFDKFEEGTNLRAWLFTILRNTFYSAKRRAKYEIADIDGRLALKISAKPDHDGRLQLADFQLAFASLPVEQREALALVGASGFSYAEAAAMCGVAIGTIKSRANRGRKRLAELMDFDQDGPVELTDRAILAVVNANKSWSA